MELRIVLGQTEPARGPGWCGGAAWPAALPRGWAAGAGWAIVVGVWEEVRRGPAAACSRGCRAALGPLSVCWQEAPAHAVLVNIQTRDFSQSKSTSTFFENLPKNSKRREFLAPSLCRWSSKFATPEGLGKGVIFFLSIKIARFFMGEGAIQEESVAEKGWWSVWRLFWGKKLYLLLLYFLI